MPASSPRALLRWNSVVYPLAMDIKAGQRMLKAGYEPEEKSPSTWRNADLMLEVGRTRSAPCSTAMPALHRQPHWRGASLRPGSGRLTTPRS